MYIYGKMFHGDYEYVPKIGASGGSSYNLYEQASDGKAGTNGNSRQTGGGGSGSGRGYWHSVYIGRGGNGTSFSGGTGSGASDTDGGGGRSVSSSNGSDIGGEGSSGCVGASNNGSYGQIALGGVGNPTGGYQAYKENVVNYSVQNGTGGLLTIYADTFENNGKITSNGISAANCTRSNSHGSIDSGGSSGGGSINIFYLNLQNKGTLNADGGESVIRERREC